MFVVYHPAIEQSHAQSLFLYPLVFATTVIWFLFSMGTSDKDGKGMLEKRFALSAQGLHQSQTERVKRFSNIPFPSLSNVLKYVFSSSEPFNGENDFI